MYAFQFENVKITSGASVGSLTRWFKSTKKPSKDLPFDIHVQVEVNNVEVDIEGDPILTMEVRAKAIRLVFTEHVAKCDDQLIAINDCLSIILRKIIVGAYGGFQRICSAAIKHYCKHPQFREIRRQLDVLRDYFEEAI